MSARDYCALQTLSGTKRMFFFTLWFTFLCCRSNKQDLRDPVKRSTLKLGPENFPRFLWEGETMDDDEPTSGFLRHPILFAVSLIRYSMFVSNPHLEQALRHFIISPSSGADPKSNLSTKSGYAKQCGVHRITLESIAYTATMVRRPPLCYCYH